MLTGFVLQRCPPVAGFCERGDEPSRIGFFDQPGDCRLGGGDFPFKLVIV